MKYLYRAIRCLTFLVLLNQAKGQNIDLDFKSPTLYDYAQVHEVLKLSNGQILVAGDMEFVDDSPISSLIKLNSDGSIDQSFNFNLDLPSSIVHLKENSKGEIIFASRRYIGKIQSNGAIIEFDENITDINDLAIQSDDKIVLARTFRQDSVDNITRLNTDFSVDQPFSASTSANNNVNSIDIKNDKIYLAGSFSRINGHKKNDVVRLNLDGSIDTSFDVGEGTNDFVGDILVQDDGKVLLGNAFINDFNSDPFAAGDGIVRLNSDGTVDQFFAYYVIDVNGAVSNLYYHEGKIYLNAFYNGPQGSNHYIIRLNNNGTLDNTFSPVAANSANEYGLNLAFTDSGIINGGFLEEGSPFGISKFSTEGSLISDFKIPLAKNGSLYRVNKQNSKLYLTGEFFKVNDLYTQNLVRIDESGSVDTGFSLEQDLGNNGQVEFTSYGEILYNTGQNFVKLNQDATIDSNFQFELFKDINSVSKFHILENDKIMIFGPTNFYRLNADGSEDVSYQNGSGTGEPSGVEMNYGFQSTGKMIVSGVFETYDETPVSGIIRVNENGTLDDSFDVGQGITSNFFNFPFDLKVFSNDSIFITGIFNEYNNEPTNGIIELGPNGQLISNGAFRSNTTCLVEYRQSKIVQFYVDSLKKYVWQRKYFNGDIDSTFLKPKELINLSPANHVYAKSINSKKAYMIGRFEINGENSSRQIIKVDFNRAPRISGILEELSIPEDSSLLITKSLLNVIDADDPLDSLSLSIKEGDFYTVEGNSIIPDPNFNGELTVNITVADRELQSEVFQALVNVTPVNDSPIIHSYNGNLSINEDDSISMVISDFSFSDVESDINEIELVLKEGSNYSISEDFVVPNNNFYGELLVNLAVTDGMAESEIFQIPFYVTPINDSPLLIDYIGSQEFNEDDSLLIKLSDFNFSDVDNPEKELELLLNESGNYRVSGNYIVPTKNYYGELELHAQIRDLKDSSNTIIVVLNVNNINDAPELQEANYTFTTNEDDSFEIKIDSFEIIDSDSQIENVRLIPLSGDNYSFSDNTIKPNQDYYGYLEFKFKLTDQIDTSQLYTVNIEVLSVNDEPIITGQVTIPELSSNQIDITLDHLIVSDPDNDYPNDFTLKIIENSNYKASDGLVTITNTEADNLLIHLTVNDGELESEVFEFEIDMAKITSSNENIITEAKIYPNPTYNSFIIKSTEFSEHNDLSILTLDGKVVKLISFKGTSKEVEISEMESGVYFIHVQSDNKWFQTKLIKN